MSVQVSLPLASEAFCLDPLQLALRSRNVWYESEPCAAGHAINPTIDPAIDLRWVCLAVDADALEPLLAELKRCPAPIDAEVHPHAAIAHLYPNGHTEWQAVVQVEFILRAELILPVLDRLQSSGVLGSGWDRVTIVRGLSAATAGDCQILPADAQAPYSHFVRWRHLPARRDETAV